MHTQANRAPARHAPCTLAGFELGNRLVKACLTRQGDAQRPPIQDDRRIQIDCLAAEFLGDIKAPGESREIADVAGDQRREWIERRIAELRSNVV